MVTGLLVKRPLSPGSDCSESESSLATGSSVHKKLTPDLINGLIRGFLLKCPVVKPDVSSQQNEKARSEQIVSW